MRSSKYRVVKPGRWSTVAFGAACALVIAAFAFRVPEGGKMASALLAILGAWLTFGPVKEREP